jgi:hypothetical protein
MKRLLCALLVLACAGPARAHFVWLLPSKDSEKPAVRVVFSDTLAPDDARLLKKIAHTKLYVRDAGGKVTPIALKASKEALEATLAGKGPHILLAACQYGVIARGKGEPFLLNYYAKAVRGHGASPGHVEAMKRTWEQSPLEIMVRDDKAACQVLWRGKPLAGADVVLLMPGNEVETKTDKDGLVKLLAPENGTASGYWGIRAGHIEKKAGALDGKKYTSVRHYATLSFWVSANKARAEGPAVKPVANAEATKLLADARAARANWKDFPGLTADLEVNVDGKVSKGKVEVSAKGGVTVTLDGEAKDWARRTLSSIVGHRLDNTTDLKTPCAFADTVTDHPLGRAIRVLNDEFHSSYRIRDRQVIVVNRQQGPVRFTIVVLENRVNEERQYLPAHYVVNTWDAKSGALKSSATHHQTWQRLGKFDLPATAMIVTASAGKMETRLLKLSNHRLREAR